MRKCLRKYYEMYKYLLSTDSFMYPEHRAVSGTEVIQADKIIRAGLSPFGNYS